MENGVGRRRLSGNVWNIRAHFDNTKFWDMGTPERLKKLEDFLDSRAI